MILDHTAIYTENLERLKDFYVKYFRAEPNEGYHNPKTGLRTYFLTFEGDSRLELMSRPGITFGEDVKRLRLGLTHIAFKLGSRELVDSLTERLKNDGYICTSAPRVTGDGYYESCVLDPDGNSVELVA